MSNQYPPSGPPGAFPPAGGPPGQPPPFDERPPVRPVGPALMVVGGVDALAALFLPWLHDTTYDGERVVLNGFQQANLNMEVGRVYGGLMLIAFGITAVACLAVFVVAVLALAVRPRTALLGTFALLAAILGLLSTLGVFLGYAVLGAIHEASYGMWIYSFAFVPVLIGALGVLSRKF